jgi:hypothetical protein
LQYKNINEIKILTSDLRVDTKLRDTIIDFSKEFKNRGIVCEMRVLNNREIYRALHDRWILSKNICFNLPSPDIVARGQYSEIKQTTSRPPFEQWWINSLDIVTDWNEIARMILDRRQEDG